MTDQPIRFVDGASYERMMGIWSHAAGRVFLDWLKPRLGLAWADVGCGNGAFTELIVERCAPSRIVGVDPSPQQLSYARTRHTAGVAEFLDGYAMALPIADDSGDAATMALVIFFVPDAQKGVAEMARVVRPGGLVAAYAWDLTGGGFPWEPLHDELRRLGRPSPMAPNAEAGRLENMRGFWEAAGLRDVETRTITVERVFETFDEFWGIALSSPTLASVLPPLAATALEAMKQRIRAKARTDGGKVVFKARANAAKGIVPA